MTERKTINSNNRLYSMGTMLGKLREHDNMTIEELAESLGVSTRMIYNYENGKNIISLEMIVKIYERKIFTNRTLEELVDIFIIQIYK